MSTADPGYLEARKKYLETFDYEVARLKAQELQADYQMAWAPYFGVKFSWEDNDEWYAREAAWMVMCGIDPSTRDN